MAKRVLDTNILVTGFRELQPYASRRPADAERQAQGLLKSRDADGIVSPVEVEFLCGIVDRHQMELAEAYLEQFPVLDRGLTPVEDWSEARRLAKHIGYQAQPRDLGDCLITAIAARLRAEIVTDDKGLIRQQGRTRRRRP